VVDQLREAIKKTVEYGREFGVEYGYEEIRERLISEKMYSDEEINSKLREIKYPNPKRINEEILRDKVEKAKILGQKLAKKFRNILLVGITGSVAAGYPKKNEDIDLMIITRKDSLWITRLKMNIWIGINRVPHRVYSLKPKKDDFCFNLWLEGESLELPINRQNLRNAMDLILMKPVINKNKIYERFLGENGWAKKYVPTGYGKKISNFKFLTFNEERNKNNLKKIINWTAFGVQYLYMKRKLTNETVDRKRAFFHPKSGRW
jgi:predicted nucleotidyltransferase